MFDIFNQLIQRIYKLILILVFFQVAMIWKNEISVKFFILIIKYFMSFFYLKTYRDNHLTLKTTIFNLFKYVKSFSNKFLIKLCVILFTYTTWKHRLMYWQNNISDKNREKKKLWVFWNDYMKLNDNDDDVITNDQQQHYFSYYAKVFEKVITNKTQKLKVFNFCQHLTVVKLKADFVNMFITTFMINKSNDFEKLMNLIWRFEFEQNYFNLQIDDYKKTKNVLMKSAIANFNAAKQSQGLVEKQFQELIEKQFYHHVWNFWWLLNSLMFKKHFAIIEKQHQFFFEISNLFLFPILTFFQLRRTQVHWIKNIDGRNRHIKNEISISQWITVELEMNNMKKANYDKIHHLRLMFFEYVNENQKNQFLCLFFKND